MVRRSKQANLYEHILKEIPLLDDDSLMALSALSRQLVIARGQAKAKLLNLKTPVTIKEEKHEEQPKG